MMKLDVMSMGVIGAFGRSADRLAAALAAPVPPASLFPLKGFDAGVPVRRVEDPVLQDPVLNPARRAGRFIKMAMLSAADCLRDASLDPPARERMGLVLVTGMGAHDVNFAFVDGLLEFGMNQGSPTHFSHSVHNAATSYIATMTGSHGPALTITHFTDPLQEGLDAAHLWLAGGICEHVLLCAVDELGAFMLSILAARGSIAAGMVPGEGAACFLLSRPDGGASRLGQIRRGQSVGRPAGLQLVDNDVWGSFPTGSAMALAARLLLLRREPPTDIVQHTPPSGIDLIELTR